MRVWITGAKLLDEKDYFENPNNANFAVIYRDQVETQKYIELEDPSNYDKSTSFLEVYNST